MKFDSSINFGVAWPVIGHLVSVLGQFGLLKILAVVGGNSLFGQFALILALVTFANMLFFGPFTQWAIRDYQQAKEEGNLTCFFYAVYKNICFATVILIFIVGSISLISELIFETNLGIDWRLMLLGAIFGMGVSLNDLIFSLLNISKHPGLSALLTALDSMIKLLVVTVTWAAGMLSLTNVVSGLILSQIVLIVVGYFCLRARVVQSAISMIKNDKVVVAKIQGDMLHYAWPFLIWGIFGYFAGMGDKWVLANYVGTSELGVYSAMALATLGLSSAITTAVNKGVVPVVFRLAGSGEQQHRAEKAAHLVNFLVILLSALFGLLILLCFLFPAQIITFFASSDFTSHKELLWLLMAAAAAINIAQTLITHGLINRSPAIYLPSKVLHGLFILIGLFIFVPLVGLSGAVYVILAGNLFQLFVVILANRKIVIS